MKQTTVLCILDGVGENPSPYGNAVAAAHTPTLDRLYKTCPHSQLLTHGPAVGLPEGQMGNSEVGHTNLGAGRIVLQQLDRIRLELQTGAFTQKTEAQQLLSAAQTAPSIHLIGMVSDGGVHSHLDHTLGLVRTLAPLGKPIYLHLITDGRDTAPTASLGQLPQFEAALAPYKNTHIASICGRFYAMDRDNRAERTQAALDLYTQGKGHSAPTLTAALAQAQARGETDEFITPTPLPPQTSGGYVRKGDVVVFTNFRADRMRQIAQAFISAGYPNLFSMTEYDKAFTPHMHVLYPPEDVKNTLGQLLADAGRTQLRIAETEKYAHVTFFFNGGVEALFTGEERVIVPSPKVRTYDLAPAMALHQLEETLCTAVRGGRYDVIICNIANGDMVGHTGNLAAATQAVEAIDSFLANLEQAVLSVNGHLFITADHGNCENMRAEDGSVLTAHSTFPVPFIYVGPKKFTLKNGRLCDVAPTLLTVLGLPVPSEMTGHSLITPPSAQRGI